MFRAISSRQLLCRCTRSTVSTKRSVIFPRTSSISLQQHHSHFRSFATQSRLTISQPIILTRKKKKKRGDKSKPQQQSPDVAKEREIQNLQQEIKWYHQQGEYDKGLETSQLLLSTTENHFGKDHPATSSAYNNVGLFHKLLGNYTEATKMYHQALRSPMN